MCLAFGSALQHQAATATTGYRGGIGLLWRLSGNRRWLTGLAAVGVGTLLHAAALHVGAVAVVESVLVTNLALALPVRVLLDRARPPAALVLAAVSLSAGVAVFVVAARPGTGQQSPNTGAAAVVVIAGVALAAICSVVAARSSSGTVAGFALGLAAGTLYGVAGGVLKGVVHTLLHGTVTVLVAGWPLWTLAALGAWAFLMHQRAYAHAPLQASLPALSVASPLAGMAFGGLAFGEAPAHAPLAVAGEVIGMAVIIGSVTMLGRLRPASN